MTSRDLLCRTDAELDQVLRSSLRQSVGSQQPPACVRDALLRAAEADLRRSLQVSSPVVDAERIGAKYPSESALWEAPKTAGMPSMMMCILEAQVSKLRCIG